jgi:hypothetical protein
MPVSQPLIPEPPSGLSHEPFHACASADGSQTQSEQTQSEHVDGTLTSASRDLSEAPRAALSDSENNSHERLDPPEDSAPASVRERASESVAPPPSNGATSQPPFGAGGPSSASGNGVATKFCGICREVLPVTEFAPNRGTYNTYCRICNQIRMKRKKWSVKALGDALAAGIISKTDITDPEPMAACPHGSVHGVQGRRCYLCGIVKPTAKFPLFDCGFRRSLCCGDCDTALRVAATHPLADVRKHAVEGYLFRYVRTEAEQLPGGGVPVECVVCGCLRPEGTMADLPEGRACSGCRLMAAACGVQLIDVKRAAVSGAVLLTHLGGAPPPANSSPEVLFASHHPRFCTSWPLSTCSLLRSCSCSCWFASGLMNIVACMRCSNQSPRTSNSSTVHLRNVQDCIAFVGAATA